MITYVDRGNISIALLLGRMYNVSEIFRNRNVYRRVWNACGFFWYLFRRWFSGWFMSVDFGFLFSYVGLDMCICKYGRIGCSSGWKFNFFLIYSHLKVKFFYYVNKNYSKCVMSQFANFYFNNFYISHKSLMLLNVYFRE